MSDIGLHGSLYGEIRELAELVDAVITDIAVDGRDAANRRKLAERLTDMTAPDSRGLVMRYLGPASALQNWGDLADALRHDPAPPWITDRLEALARLLDTRRSTALARLHGTGAR
jgi:hypothetical protein